MALIKLNTRSLSDDSVGATQIDLSDNFAFTGTVSGAGTIKQWKHVTDYGGLTQTTSTSWSDVETLDITPSSTSSQILIFCSGNAQSRRSGDQLNSLIRVARTISGGSLVVVDSADTGYADDQYVHNHVRYINSPAAAALASDFSFVLKDAPNTTSTVTYQLQHAMQSSQQDQQTGGVAITLFEV